MLSDSSEKRASRATASDRGVIAAPPALSDLRVRAHSPPRRRQESFSSLDADDEADEPAALLTHSTAALGCSSAQALPTLAQSRRTISEVRRERERAVKGSTRAATSSLRANIVDDDDDEDARGNKNTPLSAALDAERSAHASTSPTSTMAATERDAQPAHAKPTRDQIDRSVDAHVPAALAASRVPSLTSSHLRARDAPDGDSDPAHTLSIGASLAGVVNSAAAAEVASDAHLTEADVLKEAERRELLRNKMQEFGCCVLFFPAPVVSWLFPMTGNVAITNAEGSRLYTFESSYYVREEKLLSVLDTVLAEDDSVADLLEKPKPPPRPRRVTSPGGALLQPSSDGYVTSPLMGPHSPFGASLGTASGAAGTPLPPRKSKRTTSKGHAHARCVRIWDLKPLLMEARSQRRGQGNGAAGSSHRHQSGPAAALWNLLRQELNNAVYSSSMTSDSDYSAPGSRNRRATMGNRGGVTEDDDEPYEFLDAGTARMFNRNLQASIKIFRGSPHGSSTQSQRLLEELNSFSFVCFVLEACGVGGWASPSPRPARARQPPRPLTHVPPSTTATATTPATTSAPNTIDSKAHQGSDDDDDHHAQETSWGFVKLCIHLCVFGRWHRCGGRARRVLHGGSFTTALLLWALVLIFLFYYLFPPHQWVVIVGVGQQLSRTVWTTLMNYTSQSSAATTTTAELDLS